MPVNVQAQGTVNFTGLFTNANRFGSQVTPGSCSIADEVICKTLGTVEPRRGFDWNAGLEGDFEDTIVDMHEYETGTNNQFIWSRTRQSLPILPREHEPFISPRFSWFLPD